MGIVSAIASMLTPTGDGRGGCRGRAAARHPPSHGPGGWRAAVASPAWTRCRRSSRPSRCPRAAAAVGLAWRSRTGRVRATAAATRRDDDRPRPRGRSPRHRGDPRAVLDRVLQPVPLDRPAARRDRRRLRRACATSRSTSRRPARPRRPLPRAADAHHPVLDAGGAADGPHRRRAPPASATCATASKTLTGRSRVPS